MKIFKRIYNDYFMPSRMNEYEKLLKNFINNDYKFICVKEYKKIGKRKTIIIRHDIDTDLKIAKKMFEIEKKLNIKSTFYFRLSTMNKDFIKEIKEYGSEVGYHFEEIATFCKKNKNISVEFVNDNLDKIKAIFINNVKEFEAENEIKLYSVVSHGDFVNRKLKTMNNVLMDEAVRNKIDVYIEAYDIENNLDFRSCDAMYDKFWTIDPEIAIKENKQSVLLLIHTRWWGRAPLSRLKEDLKRIIEGIKY